MSKWILRDGDKYFKQMTGIGPMATTDIAEAECFDTKEEALQSPAMRFSLTFYEPLEVES